MRRTTIGLMVLLAACGGKPQQRIASITWNEHRALGEPQEVWRPHDVRLPTINWNAQALRLSESPLRFGDLPDPPAFDASVLPKLTLANQKGLEASPSHLKALTEAPTKLPKFGDAEALRLGDKPAIQFPSDWN